MLEEKQVKFIKRERVRRRLMNTKTGETICLQWYEVEMLLEWLKELEREVKELNGDNEKGKKRNRKSPYDAYRR